MFLGLSFYNFTIGSIYLRDLALIFKLYLLEVKRNGVWLTVTIIRLRIEVHVDKHARIIIFSTFTFDRKWREIATAIYSTLRVKLIFPPTLEYPGIGTVSSHRLPLLPRQITLAKSQWNVEPTARSEARFKEMQNNRLFLGLEVVN